MRLYRFFRFAMLAIPVMSLRSSLNVVNFYEAPIPNEIHVCLINRRKKRHGRRWIPTGRKAGSEWTRITIELNKDKHYPGLSDNAMI
jgi:hypothetical protein